MALRVVVLLLLGQSALTCVCVAGLNFEGNEYSINICNLNVEFWCEIVRIHLKTIYPVRPSPVGWNPGNAIQQKRNTNPIRFPSSAEQRIDYAEMDLDYETGYLRHQREQQAQGSQVCDWEIMIWYIRGYIRYWLPRCHEQYYKVNGTIHWTGCHVPLQRPCHQIKQFFY